MSVETSKQQENIFSWRRLLKTLDGQEKVDFYYEKLAQSLADQVCKAELARQTVDDNTVRKIVDQWASPQYQSFLERKLNQRKQKDFDITQGRQKIDLAMAGFFRIDHGQNNAMAKRATDEKERQKRIAQAKRVYERHVSVQRTTQTTPYTIHDGPINWDIETSQDLANTFFIKGEEKTSQSILEDAIATNSQFLGKLDPTKSENENQLYIGTLSGIGVLHTRIAKITGKLSDMQEGVNKISQANKMQPNYHRLATVSFWLIKASFTYPEATLIERVRGIIIGEKNLVDSFLHEPKSTLRAIKQSLKK